MIILQSGNLLDADAEALVNTINTVGVMGKGIALQFKNKYPENYLLYKQACQRKEIQIGRMFCVPINEAKTNPQWIINFPTKKDFKHPSRLSYIEAGLQDLVRVIQEKQIKTIAIPPLGAGNGKLNWSDVKPLIFQYLQPLEHVDIYLYEPNPNVYQELNPSRQANALPNLTAVRLMVLMAIDQYSVQDFCCTKIEIQKLVYFLQRLGASFPRLTFKPYYYGPYAPQLDHILQDLDGTYLQGNNYKEAKASDPIALQTDRLIYLRDAAQSQLSAEDQRRLDLLAELIDRYETPLGLELLATVDWILIHYPALRNDLSAVIAQIYQWEKKPERKKALMPHDYIAGAYRVLINFNQKYPFFYPEVSLY
jgi:O-acetyl-ADP-ribose deacetylase (regulator of RNase III)